MTLKSRLGVADGHWKRHHTIDHNTTYELFDVEYYDDLEMWLEVIQGHCNWYHSKALVRFPIRLL